MKRKRPFTAFIFLGMMLILYISISLYASTHSLTVNRISFISPKLSAEQCINCVFLADLHDHKFGTGNEKLIEEVAEQLIIPLR